MSDEPATDETHHDGLETRVETWLPVATPSCAVGRPRHAPSSRVATLRAAMCGIRAVAPAVAPLGSRVAWARGGLRGGLMHRARCNFQSARRGHRLFGAPLYDVSIIDSLVCTLFDFYANHEFTPRRNKNRCVMGIYESEIIASWNSASTSLGESKLSKFSRSRNSNGSKFNKL